MGNLQISEFISDAKKTLIKRSPEILTGIGIAGMITTTILAVRATPKALYLIELAKEAKRKETGEDKLTAIEVVKVAWKPYIPCVVLGTLSTGCLIGASSVNFKRNAALATAYKLTETAFTEYKEKVVETVGEKKEKDIVDKIAEDKVKNNPVSNSEVIFIDNSSNTLCCDGLYNRYFYSDRTKIERAVNNLNKRLLSENYVSLNEFYDELGINRSKTGDDVGWNIDSGLVEITFSYAGSDTGQPCLVLTYRVAPKYEYYNMY